MNEWIANLEIAAWAPTAAAFVLGVIFGWLLWGGRFDDAGYEAGEGVDASIEDEASALEFSDGEKPAANGEAPSTVAKDVETMTGAQAAAALFPSRSKTPKEAPAKNGAADDPAPPSMKFGALESELRKAKELLAEADEENGAHRERLSELESALKRANGRLKLVMKAVKKARADR